MPIITSYSESDVKDYMEATLSDTAKKLGLSAAEGDFDEPVLDVLYVLGESDFSFVDTVEEAYKVRVVAKVEAWRTAMHATAHEASHSAGNPGTGTTNRSDIFRHCKQMYEQYKSEMLESFPEIGTQVSRQITKLGMRYSGDYYDNAS